MHKVMLVVVIVLLSLSVQFVFARVFGPEGTPNFLLMGMVFLNLYRGLRYGLAGAFAGGFLLDSFNGQPYGINVLTFVICAFVTAWIKKYIYHPGVAVSRALMVLINVVIYSIIQYFFLSAESDLSFLSALSGIFIPGILLPTILASYTFERYKRCVSKLFG